jgi:hypothetical protein
MNLTEIMLQVANIQFEETGLGHAMPFVPEKSDVRENVFWSISLALSAS